MSLIVGLDIGSSSCKSCLLLVDDLSTYKIISTSIINYQQLRIKDDSNKWEIPVEVILEAIQESIKGLQLDSNDSWNEVKAIAVCGQMHGCVLWSADSWTYDESTKSYIIKNNCISNLYSWQDQRCSQQFIDSLPKSKSPLATGFGLATLFWLLRYQPDYLAQFNHTGTIMDLIVTLICQLDEPLMTSQNAAGFGYYNYRKNSWSKKLVHNNFPVNILPKLVDVGHLAGQLADDWINLPKGIPVYVSFGDLQCSTFSCIHDKPNSAVLTMSTSLQLVVYPNDQKWINLKSDFQQSILDWKRVSLIPYVNGHFIVAAASLNGGNVLEAFVNFVRNWMHDLTGSEFPKDKIWDQLNRLSGQTINDSDSSTPIKFVATLFGERYDPQLRSSLLNIPTDLTPSKLFVAICQGLIANVFTMIPIEWLTDLPIDEIKATGGALLRNFALKNALEGICQQSNIKVNYMDEADAHIGAALIVSMFLTKSNSLS